MTTFYEWWAKQQGAVFNESCQTAAQLAWDTAMAVGRNYVADDEIYPQKVTFANGRIVVLISGVQPRGFMPKPPHLQVQSMA
jgi:hypothetical protein